jgi:3-mercaptopyruvate sulfurtransferase SseA
MSISANELLAGDPGTTIINAGKSAGKREIRGAIRYRPSDLLEAEHLALPIAHDRRVILYAEGGGDETLARIADKMRSQGFRDVRVFEGTLAAYEQAGGETQEPSLEQVVPPSAPDEVQKLDRRL